MTFRRSSILPGNSFDNALSKCDLFPKLYQLPLEFSDILVVSLYS